MTIPEFIAQWRKVDLKERPAAQEHFIGLCNVFDHPTPAASDPTGETFKKVAPGQFVLSGKV